MKRLRLIHSQPVSLPCPVCGEFKAWPLTTQADVDEHVRLVHTPAEVVDAEGAGLAEFLLDRLHGCPELPDAPEGHCEDDCGHIGRRVWVGDRQVCRSCGRSRLRAARKAAA